MERTASSLQPMTEHLMPFATLPKHGDLGSSHLSYHNTRFCEVDHNPIIWFHALEVAISCRRAFSIVCRGILQSGIYSQCCNRCGLSVNSRCRHALCQWIRNNMVTERSCLGTFSWRLFRRGRWDYG